MTERERDDYLHRNDSKYSDAQLLCVLAEYLIRYAKLPRHDETIDRMAFIAYRIPPKTTSLYLDVKLSEPVKPGTATHILLDIRPLLVMYAVWPKYLRHFDKLVANLNPNWTPA